MQLYSSSSGSFRKPGFVTLLALAVMMVSGTTYALQDGGLPPIRPATVPDTSDPFQNYEQEEPSRPQNMGQNDLRGRVPDIPAQTAHATQEFPPQQRFTEPLPTADIPSRPMQTRPMQTRPMQTRPIQAQPLQAQPLQAQPLQTQPLAPRTRDVIVDPNLQPTGYDAPPPSTSPNIMLAGDFLAELAIDGRVSSSAGQPMALLDMLANCDMRRQKQLIRQYWTTYRAWAEYRFAIDELQWIQQSGQARSILDRSTLDAAQSAANDDIAARALELSRQQYLLNRFARGPQSETLPLPSDTPLVTRYRTNFDLYAARQTMPDNLRMINLWLPQQQQLIGDRAATIQRCRAAVSQSTRAVAQGQPVASMLQTIELCRTSHSNFIKTVVDYNQQIAEYALSVKPHLNSPEQVVAMLLPMNTMDRTDRFSSETRQATLPNEPYGRTTQGNDQMVLPNSLPLRSMGNPAFSGGSPGNGRSQIPAATQQPSINPGGFNSNQDFQLPPSSSGQPGGTFRR